MDVLKASERLSRIDLWLDIDNLKVNILWFRVMVMVHSDWLINRHTHSSYEFHFVSKGACRVRLDDDEFIAHAGEFYLTAPYVYHEQSGVDGEAYTEYSINCEIASLPCTSTEGDSLLSILNESGCRAVSDIYGGIRYFGEALEEADKQTIFYYNKIKSFAILVLTSAARAICDTQKTSIDVNNRKYNIPLKKTGNDFRFAEIEKFISDNILARITVSDLFNLMYLSTKQINRIIKQSTGISAKKYINLQKLKKAKSLLKDSGYSIKQISELLGFTSEYYFNQFFKREEGYPPGMFRANVRKH
jgi:AraC-like DNA-binding protein